MDDLRGFIGSGLTAARNALADTIGWAGLQLHPETVTKSLARRVRAKLRAIETVVRRLILLMAAGMDLAPAEARGRAGRQPGKPPAKTAPGYRFRLLPAAGADRAALYAIPARPAGLVPQPASAIPLRHRCDTLTRLLRHPERTARRMARLLARLRAEGAPRPICLPQSAAFRMDPELALTGEALPGLVGEALSDWYDTS